MAGRSLSPAVRSSRRSSLPAASSGSSRVRLVLFDVDGTLIHTRGVGVAAFARALESEFGRSGVTSRIRFGGRTDPSLVRELFGHAGVEHHPTNVQRFFDAYVFWLDHLLRVSGQGGACPGVWGFLQDLRRLPAPPAIGLLTGNIRLGAEIKLRHFDLWDPFETGGFGDDDEDRSGIARVARQRGGRHLGCELRGEDILVVGDTPHDVACGRAIGARVLAVATGNVSEADLRECDPDWVASTLESVNAATICG